MKIAKKYIQGSIARETNRLLKEQKPDQSKKYNAAATGQRTARINNLFKSKGLSVGQITPLTKGANFIGYTLKSTPGKKVMFTAAEQGHIEKGTPLPQAKPAAPAAAKKIAAQKPRKKGGGSPKPGSLRDRFMAALAAAKKAKKTSFKFPIPEGNLVFTVKLSPDGKIAGFSKAALKSSKAPHIPQGADAEHPAATMLDARGRQLVHKLDQVAQQAITAAGGGQQHSMKPYVTEEDGWMKLRMDWAFRLKEKPTA